MRIIGTHQVAGVFDLPTGRTIVSAWMKNVRFAIGCHADDAGNGVVVLASKRRDSVSARRVSHAPESRAVILSTGLDVVKSWSFGDAQGISSAAVSVVIFGSGAAFVDEFGSSRAIIATPASVD